VESFARHLVSKGHEVAIVTTRKTARDGRLTESTPDGVQLFELDSRGRLCASEQCTVLAATAQGRSAGGMRLLKIKRAVDRFLGQLLDHRLLFAAQFASPFLAKEVRQALSNADIVVSSSPPWITHLAAWISKKRYGLRWLADYRDQFSGNHIQVGSAFSRPLERLIDRGLLRSADCVSVISGPMKTYYEQFHARVECIENGYDEKAFARIENEIAGMPASVQPKSAFMIRYAGSISADRIPHALLQAVVQANQAGGTPFHVEFCGESSLLRSMMSKSFAEAQPFVSFVPQLGYNEALAAILGADLLYFVETSDLSSLSARGVLTTKLFEYLAAKKPVIAEIDNEALAAQYLRTSGLDMVISTDSEKIRQALMRYRNGELKLVPNESFIHSLSRSVKAQAMEDLLGQLHREGARAVAHS
jgi:glycosyltransferase involved in cell wall biosynthesis